MSRQLWRPATDSDGIPFDNLCTFAHALTEWRDEYLNLVGVPSNFEGEWDFVSVRLDDISTDAEADFFFFATRRLYRLARVMRHTTLCGLFCSTLWTTLGSRN